MCSCRCDELLTNTEEIKLDLAIAEARIEANEAAISEIRQKFHERSNNFKNHQVKKPREEDNTEEAYSIMDVDHEQNRLSQSQITVLSKTVLSLKRDMERIKYESQERAENYRKLSSTIRSTLCKIEDIISDSILKGECSGSMT